MKEILILILIFSGIFIFLSWFYFFIGKPLPVEEISWGVNFSQKHTENLGLDWRETYLALLDDLKVRNIKLITHWDLIEPEEGKYIFEDLDWQVKKAEEKGAKLLLVIGMKTGRWPECHIPEWAINFSKEEQQKEILEMLEKIVLRYKNSLAIKYWQVENEPFFPFGECPKISQSFLKKEIDLVKSIDATPVIISDSGEFSFWIRAAKLGDLVGTTLHRKVWLKELKIYLTHHWFRPIYYWRKAQIIKKLFNKKVICVELQAEPWGPTLLYDLPIKEQERTMNLKIFQENIEFAKKTGLKEFYLWGGEWWYWMKKQGYPEIWEEARKLWQ